MGLRLKSQRIRKRFAFVVSYLVCYLLYNVVIQSIAKSIKFNLISRHKSMGRYFIAVSITSVYGIMQITTSTHWILPAVEFNGLWESLVYDEDIKAQVTMMISLIQMNVLSFLYHFLRQANMIECLRTKQIYNHYVQLPRTFPLALFSSF